MAAAPAAPASGPRRPSPASSSAHHARVLSEAVLQTQRDLNESVSEVVGELRKVRQALDGINQSLSDIAGSLSKLTK